MYDPRMWIALALLAAASPVAVTVTNHSGATRHVGLWRGGTPVDVGAVDDAKSSAPTAVDLESEHTRHDDDVVVEVMPPLAGHRWFAVRAPSPRGENATLAVELGAADVAWTSHVERRGKARDANGSGRALPDAPPISAAPDVCVAIDAPKVDASGVFGIPRVPLRLTRAPMARPWPPEAAWFTAVVVGASTNHPWHWSIAKNGGLVLSSFDGLAGVNVYLAPPAPTMGGSATAISDNGPASWKLGDVTARMVDCPR